MSTARRKSEEEGSKNKQIFGDAPPGGTEMAVLLKEDMKVE
jgi:hypothetical protein